ncbi:hypothetical protein FRC00_002054 [Tulasnella sp. 408]|nr:hypothetical protein FRC00_002054 [Tulasnella sp. 408]
MDSDSEWDGMSDEDEDFATFTLGGAPTDDRVRVTNGGAQYYQSSDHWYEDGNIIFLAGNTGFRLFKSMLIKRSQVMKDMLGPSQSTTARGDASPEQSLFEGIPVVKIDDQPRYFGLLLDAILPSDITKNPIPDTLTVGTLMGVARIAKKYQVQDVLAHASRILENVLLPKEPPECYESRDYGDFELRRNVPTINWARFCGLPQFLPLPFYGGLEAREL